MDRDALCMKAARLREILSDLSPPRRLYGLRRRHWTRFFKSHKQASRDSLAAAHNRRTYSLGRGYMSRLPPNWKSRTHSFRSKFWVAARILMGRAVARVVACGQVYWQRSSL